MEISQYELQVTQLQEKNKIPYQINQKLSLSNKKKIQQNLW